MKKNKYGFLKNMAKETAGNIVICEDGKKSHTIIKMDQNSVKMWNDSHKTKLFVCNGDDKKYYDVDAFNYKNAFTDKWFWRKGDAELLKKIAKKYNLESYIIKYKRVDTFYKHWERCNDSNKHFNLNGFYESKKKELQQKAQALRNAKEFAKFKESTGARIAELGAYIQNSFNSNINNDDFYYNNVLFNIKKKYIIVLNKFNKMIKGEAKPNNQQLNNYIALISQLLNEIDNNNKTWNLEDSAKAKKIAEACYYSNKNNCSWNDAESTGVLKLNIE